MKTILFLIIFCNIILAEPKIILDSYIKNLRNLNFNSSDITVLDTSIYKNKVEVDTIYYISEQLKISAIIYIPVNKKKVQDTAIVIAHGYYNPKKYFQGQGTFETGVKLAENGFITIVSDYRGYGKSEGRTSYPYPGETIDVINSALALKKKYKSKSLALIGYSWGGGIAAEASEISEVFSQLILYYPQLGGIRLRGQEYNILKKYFKLTDKEIFYFFIGKSPIYNTKYIKIPVLIFHGLKDFVVKKIQPQTFYNNLQKTNKNIKLIYFKDYSHAFADNPANKSWDKLLNYLK